MTSALRLVRRGWMAMFDDGDFAIAAAAAAAVVVVVEVEGG